MILDQSMRDALFTAFDDVLMNACPDAAAAAHDLVEAAAAVFKDIGLDAGLHGSAVSMEEMTRTIAANLPDRQRLLLEMAQTRICQRGPHLPHGEASPEFLHGAHDPQAKGSRA